MIYATKIKMKPGCGTSNNLLEIDEVYLSGDGFNNYFDKEVVHNYVKQFSNSVYVNIYPYPSVLPAISVYGGKYIKSSPNNTTVDNLLNLPRV